MKLATRRVMTRAFRSEVPTPIISEIGLVGGVALAAQARHLRSTRPTPGRAYQGGDFKSWHKRVWPPLGRGHFRKVMTPTTLADAREPMHYLQIGQGIDREGKMPTPMFALRNAKRNVSTSLCINSSSHTSCWLREPGTSKGRWRGSRGGRKRRPAGP